MFRLIATAVLAMSLPLAAFAAAVVQSVKGDVRAGLVGRPAAPLGVQQRLEAGTAVLTGADSQAILRFDDGQEVVLNQNTEFRIVDFRYNESDAKFDRTVFDLIKGSLRMVSGTIVARNREAVALRTPQATMGIRGTDFIVALVNPAYVSVLQGAVAVTNTAGTVVLGAGTIGSVANSAALATVIPASALPAAAAVAFSNLSAAAVVGAGGAASGAGTAAGTAAAPSATAAAAAAAAAAVAGAAASNRGSNSTTTHH
jgi:hypothetical protein